MSPKTVKTVAASIGAIGLALVALMVTTEGELGALPLALVLAGAIGWGIGRKLDRRRAMDGVSADQSRK